uniref:Endoplasmic reticulum vesicle transporter C-terminal domain-containing protein n=1 Tax=Cryptomonas curvata TaxID=233186 RepID=A0A7S0LUE1_9CRYP
MRKSVFLKMSSRFFAKLRDFDVYPKTIQDYQVKTLAGAAVSVCGIILMVTLFLGELSLYLSTTTVHELSVDTSRGEKLQINFDVTFPRMPCSIISLDTMDISGEQHLDVTHEVYKQRLDEIGNAIADKTLEHNIQSNKTMIRKMMDGSANASDFVDAPTTTPSLSAETECGSCYGAEDQPGDCCNTCDEVRDAYRRRGWAFFNMENIKPCKDEGTRLKEQEEKNEGCRVTGTLEVNKVAGNFHFAPGKSFQNIGFQLHDLLNFQRNVVQHNVSHVINHLSFGKKFPGRINPLDGLSRFTEFKSGMYQYFIKVVPTKYAYLNKSVIDTNQFSSTEHFRKIEGLQRGLPGVFFFYDLSPIMVTFAERSNSFLELVTGVCAIVGGVFTVTGIIDSTIYTGQKIAKKLQLGKLH